MSKGAERAEAQKRRRNVLPKKGVSPEVLQMAESARAWAASENGREAMKKAVATAYEVVEQMREVQEPQSTGCYKSTL